MQNPTVTKSTLITGIENDAHAEEEKIINEAQKQAQQRTKYVAGQVDSIIHDAEERAKQQYESIKRTILAGAKVEVNRKSMEIRKKIMEYIDDQVRHEFSSSLKKADYEKMLLNWIVEACIALETPAASLNASAEERTIMDAGSLKKAAEMLKNITGQDIVLSLSDQPPLARQGIVATAADGKTAFNNQVITRLRRKQKEINNLIFERLFTQQE